MYRVLLVEDEESCSSIVNYVLNGFCTLEITTKGETAVEMAAAGKYDLILMDIKLNYGINGIDTTKQIRQLKGYESVPIVAFTAYAMKGDKEYFLSEGLSHYISKPFDLKRFVETIKTILLARESLD